MMKYYLGIDIGGTAVKLGLVDEAGSVCAQMERPVNFDGYKTPILDTVCKAAAQFLQERSIAAASLAGCGVSATGQIDSKNGVVAGTCGSLPGWEGSPLRASLEELLHLPVTVANDANCMCLGEAWVGAAKGCREVIGITIGTGLGGGILTGGRLLEGASGLAGELGHMRIHAGTGIACTCGGAGCWERYAATTALVRALQKENPELDDGRKIFAAAKDGNPAVCRQIDAWLNELAFGLIGLVHLFNPQIILVGGGVSAQQDLLIDPLREKVVSGVMPAFAAVALRAAALRNTAGLVGAVAYYISKERQGDIGMMSRK